MGLYYEPLTIYAVLHTDGDKIIARRRFTTLKFDTYSRANHVFSPTASGSLGTDVLSRAATDPALAEALSLVGHEAPTWGRVYDFLEFVGVRSGQIRQTANHYRHLGNPKNSPLPKNPPTLVEAALFAINRLKEWIAERT